jgi:hypothetical protein
MKIKCCTAIVFLLLIKSFTASAQLKGFSFGPYFEAAWPNGDFAIRNGNGIGIGGTADINLPGRFSATGSIGYMHFKKYTGPENHPTVALNAMPVRAGIKYKMPLVYLKLEGGAARISGEDGSAVIVSPGLGVRLLGLDVQGNYETWLRDEGWSFWALRISYHF